MWKHPSFSPPSPKQRSLGERHWNHKVCFLWMCLPMVTVNAGICYIGEVTTSCSSQNAGFDARDDVTFARKGWAVRCQPDCYALEVYWPVFTVAISRSAISTWLGPARSVWLARALQKTPTWSKLWLPGCRHLTLNSSTLHANLAATVGSVMRNVCCTYTEGRIQFSVLRVLPCFYNSL